MTIAAIQPRLGGKQGSLAVEIRIEQIGVGFNKNVQAVRTGI